MEANRAFLYSGKLEPNVFFFFSSRSRHTIWPRDWSSDVCSSDLCRAAGIAARYVSGHLAGDGGSHAWVEALVPDPDRPGESVVEGWDPTHDRPVGDGYVTVAVGRDYADVAPLSGSYVADRAVGH